MRFAPGRRSPARIAKQFASPVLLAVSIGLMLGGCSALRHGRDGSQGFSLLRHGGTGSAQVAQAQPLYTPPAQAAAAGNGGIEKIPFRVGVSTATVERLAKQQACTGGQGAGLITQDGPVEIYRMQCDNGKTFMARCELRQCKPM